jgi:hypothetical protein
MNRVILSILLLGILGCGIGMGHAIWGHNQNNSAIAPTYALDNNHIICPDVPWHCSTDGSIPFGYFWEEATKDTQFTIDGKPVEITDVQVFYRIQDNSQWRERYDRTNGTWTIIYFYTFGNITYYPLGIQNSQTYVAPTPTTGSCSPTDYATK